MARTPAASTFGRARRFATWAVGSALTRGPGYEPHPPGGAFEPESVKGYYLDYSAKTSAAAATRPAQLRPAGLAQLALGWWERSLRGDARASELFRDTAERLLAGGERADDALLWHYDVRIPKYGLIGPWTSALAQGQAASVFVRMYVHDGDHRWAEAARAAVEPLLAPAGALVTATAAGPVLEEAPSSPPSHILNGWIAAVFGLLDVSIELQDEAASRVFTASVAALERFLPAYDTGWWSRYSLFPHPLDDLAKPIYHRLHGDQLEMLYRVTGVAAFNETCRRWRGYDTTVRRAASVAQKSLFVVVDGRRRHRDGRLG